VRTKILSVDIEIDKLNMMLNGKLWVLVYNRRCAWKFRKEKDMFYTVVIQF
jgi:hypothetical protein